MIELVELTIKVPSSMVSRLQDYGVSDIEASIEAFLRQIDEGEIAEISKKQAWRPPTDKEAQATIAALDAAIGKLNTEFVKPKDAQARVVAFFEAFEKLREGLSDEELETIANDMNAEYVDPDDLHLFDWLEDIPEEDR